MLANYHNAALKGFLKRASCWRARLATLPSSPRSTAVEELPGDLGLLASAWIPPEPGRRIPGPGRCQGGYATPVCGPPCPGRLLRLTAGVLRAAGAFHAVRLQLPGHGGAAADGGHRAGVLRGRAAEAGVGARARHAAAGARQRAQRGVRARGCAPRAWGRVWVTLRGVEAWANPAGWAHGAAALPAGKLPRDAAALHAAKDNAVALHA